MRFLTKGFLHGSVSPKPLVIPLSETILKFLENSWRYLQLKCNTGVVDTSGKWKNLQSENFHYFFWTPLGSRVSIKIHFFYTFILKVSTNEKRGGLKVVTFDRSPFKVFSLRFSKNSVQAQSCKRPKTTQRTLFLLFEINSWFPITV
jgi:hypothetical protein